MEEMNKKEGGKNGEEWDTLVYFRNVSHQFAHWLLNYHIPDRVNKGATQFQSALG